MAHGRAVLDAGLVPDVNQIKRDPRNPRRAELAFHAPEIREVIARRAAKALTAVVGLNVPVTAVLTFVGSGVISVHGLPKDCLVSTDKELDP